MTGDALPLLTIRMCVEGGKEGEGLLLSDVALGMVKIAGVCAKYNGRMMEHATLPLSADGVRWLKQIYIRHPPGGEIRFQSSGGAASDME